ncbi:hypothetical protein GHT06_021982 [Daphnia sinensis]|uniref:Uncharacterized protein n=1 Tax=Daphnia sinensis TaxID=1820382 RepID=A0AAD5KHT7_9CRUS|nr:hypothetical protein GHT06_021982 [Daphnia sinensis]
MKLLHITSRVDITTRRQIHNSIKSIKRATCHSNRNPTRPCSNALVSLPARHHMRNKAVFLEINSVGPFHPPLDHSNLKADSWPMALEWIIATAAKSIHAPIKIRCSSINNSSTGFQSLPSVPLLPATSTPPGWNDPPPPTSFAKVKAEPTTVETINHPMGIVEQPAVPITQPFDGLYNPGMTSPVEPTQNQSHVPEPIPVQPVQALLPIPKDHRIIHDIFRTLKNKCVALATNAGVDTAMVVIYWQESLGCSLVVMLKLSGIKGNIKYFYK